MKNTIALFKKYFLVIVAVLICGFSVFQKCDSKLNTLQPATVDQSNINKSKEDSLKTVRANILLNRKDSIIQILNSKLANEKANTATLKAVASKLHKLNDTIQSRFEKDKDLSTCEDLVQGLKLEILGKDSVIKSLDSEIDHYGCEISELEEKVDIQKGLIDGKQNLLAYKDSTIAYYKSQQKKTTLWQGIKTKLVSAIILVQTIALVLK